MPSLDDGLLDWFLTFGFGLYDHETFGSLSMLGHEAGPKGLDNILYRINIMLF